VTRNLEIEAISLVSESWEEIAPGARQKSAVRSGKRVRLVELSPAFVENDWCTKEHVIHVLEGELELTFPVAVTRYRQGDCAILGSGAATHHHKARAVTAVVLLFIVDEA
jgi:quercetin dioxygenase-like cupin family protein